MSGMDVDNKGIERKGRGFASRENDDSADVGGHESVKIETVSPDNAQRSVEGWIIMVRGVHEEATEEDVQDKFADYGEIRNLHLNLDRRTGFVKGYALIEYAHKSEAEAAIKGASGTQLLEQELSCDFAFIQPPVAQGGKGPAARGGRGRSQSPTRRKPLITRID